MRVVATYSIKGGVGKTSAAVNLAAAAAGEGAKVLVWDLDPQAAATFLLRVKPRVKGGGRGLVRKRVALADAARASDVANLDLVPADFRYRHLDLDLGGLKRPTSRIADLLAPLADTYDWVFLDCAPSISLVSEGVFAAADLLLVPLIPSTLSLRTLDQLVGFLSDPDGAAPPEVLAFFSMVDRRKSLHRQVVEDLPRERPGLVAATVVPAASIVERMGLERAPLCAFAPGSAAARAYLALWGEVAARGVT